MSLWERVMVAIDAFRHYGAEPERALDDALSRYADLWAFLDGSWRNDPAMQSVRQRLPRLYEHTRLNWRYASAVIDLYEHTTYLGALSTDGKPLPDGTLGAIPIVPQTTGANTEARDAALLKACSDLWVMWNFGAYKGFRPKVTAALGHCLTEIVDEPTRFAYPALRTIWPGYVTDDLELDDAGNVKRYALEYQIDIRQSAAFGREVPAESYRFRKEVDGEALRFYKNDRPFDYFGPGSAVQENIYGFAPAVWDRAGIDWSYRSVGRIDPIWQQAREMNSLLSHAQDYQRKQFAAPIVVMGRIQAQRDPTGQRTLTFPRIARSSDPQADAEADSERLDILEVSGEGGGISSIIFDIGKTKDLLAFMQDNIFMEIPEGQFGQKLREMSTLTGPGARLAMTDIIGKIEGFREKLDPGTVGLHRMSIAILGERLRRGDYPAEKLSARHESFRPFDLTSWKRGDLDMVIRDRPVIPESEREKIERLVLLESLTTDWGKQQAGMPEEVIAQQQREAERERERLDAALTGFGERDQRAASGPSGPSGPSGQTGATR